MEISNRIIICISLLFSILLATRGQSPVGGWKAGTARIDITPTEDMWMAGFAARTHPSEGILTPLWAKALVLEDVTGNRSVLVTCDLLGIPKEMSDKIRKALYERLGFSKAQIIINSSHTHSGPVLPKALTDIYPLNDAEQQKIDRYGALLEKRIVELVVKAAQSPEPARLFAANGNSRMQVNRRQNAERNLLTLTELKGPNDFAVPVLKVMSETGQMKAVVFGYACHATVMDGYLWSGDWPGFAQIALEERHPDAMVMFMQGAGADLNPMPRKKASYARQYGKTVAAAVEQTLEEPMTELQATLRTAYDEIDLPLTAPPTPEELDNIINTLKDYRRTWALRMKKMIADKQPFITSYPYPVQAWNLGGWPLFALGGELTVGYSIFLKQTFGLNTFVLGYSNDVMAYIPTEIILKEGGYEGATSQMVYGLPSKWAAGIETLIQNELKRIAQKCKIDIIK